MAKSLPKDITSYDLLKSFAVVIMIIDHIGMYFFPEQLWWRATGRICVPIWFFLIGFARSRDIPVKLMAGAGILTFGNILAGMPLFPLNILFTIAFVRIAIDRVMAAGLKETKALWGISLILFILILPSYFLSEYGVQALILAMFGYFVRRRHEVGNDKLVIQYMVFALSSFVMMQQVYFAFTLAQFLFMVSGVAFAQVVLYYFRSYNYPSATKILPGFLVWLVQLGGRRTLEIYVVHLLLFKAIAFYLGMEGFGFFEWSWF